MTVEEALQDIRAGGMVIVVDHEDNALPLASSK